ncbi:hypothetical protein MVEG_05842 [Podila verticillata NRRL 6337]|nr:hypothetical protein MVEG_05842 [Podila verticillata NRRL 6337]
MTSYKRSVHTEEPWLRYPDPLKASHGHSRAFSPTPPSQHHIHATKSLAITETSLPGLNHKRSSSKLKQNHTSPSALPQRHHNHHTQGHHHPSKSSRPKTLSDELNFALNGDHSDTNSYTSSHSSTTNLYPSPVTPSDLLSIPNYAASTTSTTSTSSSSSHFPLRNRPESPVKRSNSTSKRPSPLSINTNLTQQQHQQQKQQHAPRKQRPDSFHMESPTSTLSRGSELSPRATGGLGTSLPRLTPSFSSSASNSSCSNVSSPSSSTAPCSALCQKNHSHSHPHHNHNHSHNHHNHHNHHHHPSCNHKHTRPHRHHHPGCQHHRGERRERSETLQPMSLEEEMGVTKQEVEGGLILPPPEPITETSMVVATFGGEKQETPKHAKEPSSESTLGLYEEPPKKKMRSTAAILLGAAVETVILTSAVALSAYNLLTGKGKDPQDATEVVEEPKPQEPEKPVLQIQSAPVNIPRGHTSGAPHRSPRPHMAHSYHHTSHHYKSSKSKNKANNLLSSSLPHAQTHRYGPKEPLPGRPDTGTEDNDEQFLRMEAQLTNLIAEGKRALSTRIESFNELEASAHR